ncbi:rhodanese-like domain-containing protein [Variovorax sp. M-6]|uniref:rhodanese-like domain-containing protein n=1 Tax=Variovorax sp. M-6 TaxID=3233041 RepID=UPI003F9A0B6E
MAALTPLQLHARLRACEEIALLDVREPGEFRAGHLLLASNAPASRLELMARQLVPRVDVPVVLCTASGDDSRLERAVAAMQALGYLQVHTLLGGVQAWSSEGLEVFTGFNVLSKAYGEWLEVDRHTPAMDARTLHAKVLANEVMVIDCRPADEHARGAVPGALNLSGAEIVRTLCVAGRVPDKPVVVHCAGRTRGIVAAQSLIDHGLGHPVYVLENGLMGWQLAGFPLSLTEPAVASAPAGVDEAALRRARAHALRAGVPMLDAAGFGQWRDEAAQRSLFCFDVRTRDEHEAGHPPGFRHMPGGQFLQSVDDLVGVQRGRIVLWDAMLVRAVSVAAFLREFGRYEVAVLDPAAAIAAGLPPIVATAAKAGATEGLTPVQANALVEQGAAVVDLGNSRRYAHTRIRGAMFGIRSLLARYADQIEGTTPLLLVCDDARLSRLAAPEFASALHRPVRFVEGGMEAWLRAGLPLAAAEDVRYLSEPMDVPTTPYDDRDDIVGRMKAYIQWELGLMAQIEREGIVRFGVPWVRGQVA